MGAHRIWARTPRADAQADPQADPRADPRASAGLYARYRTDLLVAAAVLLMAAPIVQLMMAQQESRFALTAALTERGTVVIDAYEHILGVDRAVRDGHTYSDKAPGQPVLAVPAYALYRALGGTSAIVQDEIGNLGLWATSVATAALPAAALAVLMRRLARRVAGPRWALAAALGLALGSLLLPFSTLLFGHVLAGFLSLSAFALVLPAQVTPRRLTAGGLVAGLAVLTEFTTAIVAIVLVGFVAWRHRGEVLHFVVGGLGPAAALFAYNSAVFGGPLSFSYEASETFGAGHRSGLVGVQLPDAAMALRVAFGERGLFTLTPVVLAGVLGSVGLALHTSGDRRALGVVGLVVFGLFFLVQAGWGNPFGGASPGPRYVTPALPFLAPGVAYAFRRAPVVTATATAVGVVTMLIATLTLPLAQPTEPFAVGYWVSRLAEGRTIDTVLTMAFGSRLWLFVPPLLAYALSARLLARPALEVSAEEPRGPAPRPASRMRPEPPRADARR